MHNVYEKKMLLRSIFWHSFHNPLMFDESCGLVFQKIPFFVLQT